MTIIFGTYVRRFPTFETLFKVQEHDNPKNLEIHVAVK